MATMAAPPELPVSRARKKKRWVLILGSLVFFVVVAGIPLSLFYVYQGRLTEEIESIRAERAELAAEMEAEGLTIYDEAWCEL